MATSHAPESFRSLLLRHRGRTGLIQREVAERAGVSRGAVQDWEAGVNYPTAERLQALVRVLLEAGGFTAGQEASEALALWQAAQRESTRMRTPFDEQWFARLVGANASAAAAPANGGLDVVAVAGPLAGAVTRAQDWGEAPDTLEFVGRADELALLRRWVLEERHRLVAVLGMGGIGKTSLAARLAQDVAPSFARVYWRSLRDAPPVSDWLAGAIGFLSDQQLVPQSAESERIAALLRLLRERRCLLVLDNSEALFEPEQREGLYREGMAGYGRVFQAVGESWHQSCLVLTSREAPPELAVLGGAARTFELGGLGADEAQVLLAGKQLSGTRQQWGELNARFGGNGLALKVVGGTIRELFVGDIGAFLDEASKGSVFGGIRLVLTEQVDRSSALERKVLRLLAVEREPVSIGQILAELAPSVGRPAVLEAVEALRRRSLVDRAEIPGAAAFTLQSVVLEYVTDLLVEAVADEIARGEPVLLLEQPLIRAQAKDYVRQTEERLIGTPIVSKLVTDADKDSTERRLLGLLAKWRFSPPVQQGYGPGNVVNLLRLERANLRGLDLSGLSIRQAYLAEVDAQNASLVGAHLSETVLAEAFHFPPSIALSGDGALLAAGTSTGELWLWQVADRTPVWVAAAHAGGVWSVALSDDGQLLLSGGADGQVRLWDANTGQPLTTLQGHTGTVWGVALCKEAQLVVSGGEDGTVRLWDLSTGRARARLHGHAGGVLRVAISSDCGLVASGGADGTVRLWSLAGIPGGEQSMLGMQVASSGRPVSTLLGHGSAVWGVALSTDGKLLVSGGADGTVRLWETSTGRSVATLQGHVGTVWSVALSTEAQLVTSAGEDGTVRLWQAATARPVATLQGHTGTVWGVAMSSDGQLVASGGEDGRVRLWDSITGHALATLQGHTGGVLRVAVSGDGQVVASGSADGTVHLWSLTGVTRRKGTQRTEDPSARPVAALRGITGTVWGLAISDDGHVVASGDANGTVRLWEAATGRQLAALQGHTGAVSGVALSADAQVVASGGADATVRLWESNTGRRLATLEGHTGGVWRVALSADARLVASGGSDGIVRLWSITGATRRGGVPGAQESRTASRLMAEFPGHTGAVSALALSADGQFVASGDEDGNVRLWSLAGIPMPRGAGPGGEEGMLGMQEASTGKPVATLKGHTSTVWGVALSADCRLMASGGTDGTVRLWSCPSGGLLATLQGNAGGVFGVALSADGELVASGGFDGTVRLWETDTGSPLLTLRPDRRYERLDITGLTGITAAQHTALVALGAVERPPVE